MLVLSRREGQRVIIRAPAITRPVVVEVLQEFTRENKMMLLVDSGDDVAVVMERLPSQRVYVWFPERKNPVLIEVIDHYSRDGKVRLGFDADEDIEIWREEIDWQIQEQRKKESV